MANQTPPWNADSVRLTLFLKQEIDAANLFQTIVGQPPEVDENKPRERVRRQHGVIDETGFVIQAQPTRLDIFVVPPTTLGTTTSIAPFGGHIGAFEPVFTQFKDLLTPWLSSSPKLEVNRFAVGAVLTLPMANRLAAYEALKKYVPSLNVDPATSKEVVFQVNHPAPSKAIGSGAMLNRVTKWHTLIVRQMIFTPGMSLNQTAEEEHHLYLECDHSTPAEREEVFNSDLYVPIVDELCTLVLENYERGELG